MGANKKPLTLKQLKAKEEMRQLKLEIRRDIKKSRDAKYNSISLEMRREFIKLMHEGKKFGDAAKEVGIDNDTALEVFCRNHKKKTRVYYEFTKPEDVK